MRKGQLALQDVIKNACRRFAWYLYRVDEEIPVGGGWSAPIEVHAKEWLQLTCFVGVMGEMVLEMGVGAEFYWVEAPKCWWGYSRKWEVRGVYCWREIPGGEVGG